MQETPDGQPTMFGQWLDWLMTTYLGINGAEKKGRGEEARRPFSFGKREEREEEDLGKRGPREEEEDERERAKRDLEKKKGAGKREKREREGEGRKRARSAVIREGGGGELSEMEPR